MFKRAFAKREEIVIDPSDSKKAGESVSAFFGIDPELQVEHNSKRLLECLVLFFPPEALHDVAALFDRMSQPQRLAMRLFVSSCEFATYAKDPNNKLSKVVNSVVENSDRSKIKQYVSEVAMKYGGKFCADAHQLISSSLLTPDALKWIICCKYFEWKDNGTGSLMQRLMNREVSMDELQELLTPMSELLGIDIFPDRVQRSYEMLRNLRAWYSFRITKEGYLDVESHDEAALNISRSVLQLHKRSMFPDGKSFRELKMIHSEMEMDGVFFSLFMAHYWYEELHALTAALFSQQRFDPDVASFSQVEVTASLTSDAKLPNHVAFPLIDQIDDVEELSRVIGLASGDKVKDPTKVPNVMNQIVRFGQVLRSQRTQISVDMKSKNESSILDHNSGGVVDKIVRWIRPEYLLAIDSTEKMINAVPALELMKANIDSYSTADEKDPFSPLSLTNCVCHKFIQRRDDFFSWFNTSFGSMYKQTDKVRSYQFIDLTKPFVNTGIEKMERLSFKTWFNCTSSSFDSKGYQRHLANFAKEVLNTDSCFTRPGALTIKMFPVVDFQQNLSFDKIIVHFLENGYHPIVESSPHPHEHFFYLTFINPKFYFGVSNDYPVLVSLSDIYVSMAKKLFKGIVQRHEIYQLMLTGCYAGPDPVKLMSTHNNPLWAIYSGGFGRHLSLKFQNLLAIQIMGFQVAKYLPELDSVDDCNLPNYEMIVNLPKETEELSIPLNNNYELIEGRDLLGNLVEKMNDEDVKRITVAGLTKATIKLMVKDSVAQVGKEVNSKDMDLLALWSLNRTLGEVANLDKEIKKEYEKMNGNRQLLVKRYENVAPPPIASAGVKVAMTNDADVSMDRMTGRLVYNYGAVAVKIFLEGAGVRKDKNGCIRVPERKRKVKNGKSSKSVNFSRLTDAEVGVITRTRRIKDLVKS